MNKIKYPIIAISVIASFSSFAGKQHLINSLDFEFNQNEKEEISSYVLNGSDANLADFPFYAGLILTDGDLATGNVNSFGQFCGGSILNNEYILTAAHCVTDINENLLPRYGVIINTTDIRQSSLSNTYHIDKIFYHKNYNLLSSNIHDIAVIKLGRTINTSFTPISIPTESEKNYYSDTNLVPNLTIVGRGYIDNFETNTTMIKQAELTNKNDFVCNELVEKTYPVSYEEVYQNCIVPKEISSGVFTGACSGDSGGPLSYLDNLGKYKQIALTSYGSAASCNSEGIPQVFTELYGHSEWIQKIISNNGENYISIPNNNTPPDSGKDTDDDRFNGSGDSGGSVNFLFLIFIALFSRLKILKNK